MKLYKLTLAVLTLSCALFAQDKITPTVGMAWDYDLADDSQTITPDQRIGIRVGDSKKRFYGFDTNGTDHRTILGYSFAMIGIGVTEGADDTNDTWITLGATYSLIKGVNTELEFVHYPKDDAEDFDSKSNLRLSLVLTF